MENDIDDCAWALNFAVDDKERLRAEGGAVIGVNFRPYDDVGKAVLVFKRNKVMPFGGWRCLVHDGDPGGQLTRSALLMTPSAATRSEIHRAVRFRKRV